MCDLVVLISLGQLHPLKCLGFSNLLGGGFKQLLFAPLPGEMIQFDDHILQMGWNHQLV